MKLTQQQPPSIIIKSITFLFWKHCVCENSLPFFLTHLWCKCTYAIATLNALWPTSSRPACCRAKKGRGAGLLSVVGIKQAGNTWMSASLSGIGPKCCRIWFRKRFSRFWNHLRAWSYTWSCNTCSFSNSSSSFTYQHTKLINSQSFFNTISLIKA